MANRGKKKAVKPEKWVVSIPSNPNYCGESIGGVQFAYGQAEITDPWLAEWFKTHEGYEVESIVKETDKKTEEPKEPETATENEPVEPEAPVE